MWVYHKFPRTRISCCASHLTPKESAKQAAAAVPRRATRSLCVFWWNMTAFLCFQGSILLLVLVYLFWLLFSGAKRLWASCPQCGVALHFYLEWAEYQHAFCIPQGEGSIDGSSPTWHLCSCLAVLSTYNCWLKHVKAAAKGVIRGSVVLVWSQGNWLEVGHAEAVRKRPGSVEGYHWHHWKGHGLQQDSHENVIRTWSFHICLPSTTNWWHTCPLQKANLWVSVQIDLQQPTLNPNSKMVCRLFAADTDANLTWIHPEGHWCFGNISREAASGQPDSQIYSGWEQWHHGVIKNNSVKDHNETVLQPTLTCSIYL